MLGVCLNILVMAYLLTTTQDGLPFALAVWHCFTTAPTNGGLAPAAFTAAAFTAVTVRPGPPLFAPLGEGGVPSCTRLW